MKFEPGTKVGPYQILGELGQGGMATVYRAYQPALEREVALKILPEFLLEEPGFKMRFHREAVAVARLQHPNILSVFDHGEYEGVTYIVSEYIEGGTLAARLGAPIQLDYCVRMLRPIADALDYAHGEGVVHRDVKPSNILLDRRGIPILSDFGLARLAETRDSERLTQTGATVGTPTYMAPEQCAGEEAGAAADIYALAVIAYEMITGRVPFSAPTPLGVMSAHQLKPPPSPRKMNPSLPVVVEAPMLAGLAKDPAERPATATDFVEALGVAVSAAATIPPFTPAPVYPLSPPPPSQIPAAQTPLPPSQVAPPPTPMPPSISWPASPLPTSVGSTAPPVSDSPPSETPMHSPPPPTEQPPYYSPAPAGPPSPPPAPYIQQETPTYSPPQAPAAPSQQYTSPYTYPQPAYSTPASTYAPQAPWSSAPPRPMVAGWVQIVLAVGAGLSALGLLIVAGNLASSELTGSDRWTRLLIGALLALASALSLGALLGLRSRDKWASMMAWAAVAALALTLVGIPLAAAAAWGLMSRSGSQAGAMPKTGGDLRLGGTALLLVAMLALPGSTAAWGFSQSNQGSGFVVPTPSSSSAAKICTSAKADSQIGAGVTGELCGSPIVQMNCRGSTALPSALTALGKDWNKSGEATTAGTLSMDGQVCHLTASTYKVETRLESVDPLPAGDIVMVADFVPNHLDRHVGIGVDYACDSNKGCIEATIFTSGPELDLYEGTTFKGAQPVTLSTGTNRVVLVLHQSEARVWLNGALVQTSTGLTPHEASKYRFYFESFDKTNAVSVDLLQFAVFRPAP